MHRVRSWTFLTKRQYKEQPKRDEEYKSWNEKHSRRNKTRLNETKEQMNELENTAVEITEAEQKKRKRKERKEDCLRDLWNSIRRKYRPTEYIEYRLYIDRGEYREKEAENIVEDIIDENFLNVGKEIDIQVQEVQKIQFRINPKRTVARDIIAKRKKNKDREY